MRGVGKCVGNRVSEKHNQMWSSFLHVVFEVANCPFAVL